jgi:hypothetical protein
LDGWQHAKATWRQYRRRPSRARQVSTARTGAVAVSRVERQRNRRAWTQLSSPARCGSQKPAGSAIVLIFNLSMARADPFSCPQTTRTDVVACNVTAITPHCGAGSYSDVEVKVGGCALRCSTIPVASTSLSISAETCAARGRLMGLTEIKSSSLR